MVPTRSLPGRSLGAMPVPPGQPVMECTIELRDVTPRVWRRLLVPASARLHKLHGMFQAAMGWEDCHLHSFDIGEDHLGPGQVHV